VDLPLAFNSELATQLLVNGLTLGSLYALIALGYTMVYGILKLLNFAHGDVYMVGAFVGFGVLQAFGGPLSPNIFIVNGVNVQLVQVLVMAMTLALMVALTLLVARTRIGKAMRATAFDREGAAMMGIDVDRVIASTFFIGSMLAGAAGVMFGLLFSQIFHFMGFLAGLKGFTAAVVGGIGSIPGAMLGGILVGLAEAYATGYVGGRWSDLIVFGILIFVLLVRPSGLLGTRAIQKV
jgi:branched-chain amino acid transport system permease protein